MEWYVRNAKSYPILSVLSVAPDLTLEININPDSKEYALLEKHASAFPGYTLLKKELDPIGEGKTLSKAFQDSLQRFNLDFEGDIKPLLGESAYIIVSDMSPLGESFQKGVVATGASLSQKIAGTFSFHRKIALSNQPTDVSTYIHPTVLGDMTVRGVENDFAPEKPIDFLVASPVHDWKKAFEVLEKLETSAKFDMEKRTYRGLSYFKVSMKTDEKNATNEVSRFIRFRTLYHGIVGGNWVCGSSEDELKRILDRQAKRHMWSPFVPQKQMATLADNADFLATRGELGNPQLSDSLIIGYFNVASSTFLKKSSCSGNSCEEISDFIRYPERILVGWSLGFTEAGADIRWTSKTESEPFPGKPEQDSFVNLVPQKADGKWLNIFAEHDGPKNRFYDFKRTRLTEKGRESWEALRRMIQQATTIDIERDVIDHFSENVAFSILTAKDVEPEGVLVARVDSPTAVRATIEKGVEFIRNMLILQKDRVTAIQSSYEKQCDSLYAKTSDREKCMLMARSLQLEGGNVLFETLIASANLRETMTPEGAIYSFKLSNEFPYSLASFDFGFRDNVLVLGTHFAAVETFLRETTPGRSTEKKLSNSDFYGKAKSLFLNESSQSSFVVSAGAWDVTKYVLETFSKGVREFSNEFPEISSADQGIAKQEMDDALFAFGAILRTVKLIGSDAVSRNGFETASTRCIIEALPPEEKLKAEQILEKIPL